MNKEPIVIHSGSPFFEVAQCRELWFLQNGYHRALISHLPAVIVRAGTLEEFTAVYPWFVPEEVLFSGRTAASYRFSRRRLVFEYQRSPLKKSLASP